MLAALRLFGLLLAPLSMVLTSCGSPSPGPADKSFPDNPSLSEVSIRLERTTCFGWCPAYQVEISGDGRVTYTGKSSVLIPGRYSWRISEDDVHTLLEIFRRADFFKLDDRYVAAMTDLPTYIVELRIGSRKKSVSDYGGGPPAQGVAAFSFVPGGNAADMPAIVSEIENAIDRISEAESWVYGNAQTIERLRKANWNIRSAESASAVAWLVGDCKVDLIKQFLQNGAPATGRMISEPGAPAIADAARCGDMELIRLLEKGGALNQRRDLEDFMLESVNNGYPEMVELALAHGAEGDMTDRKLDLPMIVYAVTAYKMDEAPGSANFDPAKVVTMLTTAGADPRWTSDNDDGTLLHEARLQQTHSAEVAKALVAAGVPVSARDWRGRTALFEQKSADMTKVLVAAGADVNAKDNEGETPLETVASEEAALTLLSLGAKPPGEAERLQRLKERAEEKGWMRFLEALR